MQQKSVALTKRQWEELKGEAQKIGLSVSEYLRRVIDFAKSLRQDLTR